jgi:polyphosphate kinase 2
MANHFGTHMITTDSKGHSDAADPGDSAGTVRPASKALPVVHPTGPTLSGPDGTTEPMSSHDYRSQLRLLQIELVKLQRQIIRKGDKVVIVLEGRDAAGKDGSIKRIVKYLSPRESRVVALGKPSDRQSSAWYFQRYVNHLPVASELVLFNRSWYNRAGVERVMGFCSKDETESFLQSAPRFEAMLVHDGFTLLKYYIDIGKGEQQRRLAERARDPLKQWKVSSIDAVAVKHWNAYSTARDTMLLRTHTDHAPWVIVRGNDKRLARLNLMRDILARFAYPGKSADLTPPDPEVAFEFTLDCIGSKHLAR